MGKWTRRGFITAGALAGGGLLVGVAIRPGDRHQGMAALVAAADEALVNAWVKIGADNSVTAIVPHCEMGQGVHTSLVQMLADELDAAWENVSMLEAPAVAEYANYPLARGVLMAGVEVPRVLLPTVDGALLKLSQFMDLQITGGSTSIRGTGQAGMRVAGAAAREMLLSAAASAWQAPKAQLRASEGHILHPQTGRRAPFATFAAAAAEMTPPAAPKLKAPADFRFMGKSPHRLDIPAKVDGSAQFGIDAQLPGMRYAAIRRSPVFGGLLDSSDAAKAEGMPGNPQIVRLDNAVAVVADGYWQAQQALNQVQASWRNEGLEAVSQNGIFAQFAQDLDAAAASNAWSWDRDEGDAAAAFANADKVVSAEYRAPYLAHAPMEPLNATAWVREGKCDLWTGSQNPLAFRTEVAAALGLDAEAVTIHNLYLGGGFGRRAQADYAVQAALVANAAKVPVKLIYSREEDLRQDNFRPAAMSRFRAALDASGRVLAWENGYVDKHEPAEAPLIPYAVASQSIGHTRSPTHVPFGPWRSVDHSQHGFFTEGFADELAAAAGRDPYEFRRDLLDGAPRHRAVLDRAAAAAGWGQPMPEGRGRGIALQESFGTIVAQVAEVTVQQGKVQVDRVVCVVDPGFAISPNGLVAQMESGIIYGLSAALYGEITIVKGAVAQSNFHDYPVVRMDEAPHIETHIINSGAPLGGGGEPGTPAIAPALANAIYAATGTRIRELPISKYDLDYRVEERDRMA